MGPRRATSARRLSGLDVRMVELKKTRLRAGYRRADVDDYLLEVATELDRCHDDIEDLHARLRDHARPTTNDDAALLLEAAQNVARDTRRTAEASASELVRATKRSLGELERRAGEKRRELLTEAHRQARELVEQARSTAEQIERRARERGREIEHLESELELRLGYAERRLDERAHALETEARRLDELAEWLAQHDLLPDIAYPEEGRDADDEPTERERARKGSVQQDPAGEDPAEEGRAQDRAQDLGEEARRIIELRRTD